MRRKIVLILSLLFLASPSLHAKKLKKAPPPPVLVSAVQQRFDSLSADDKRKFDALSDDQKEKIKKGEIGEGFNEWMVELALGKPFYATEHHPKFVDYEQVWLYTKLEITQDVSENRIFDQQTNWPTIHRITHKKTCHVSDFFVLWDRGVVQEVRHETAPQVHGSCTLETEEAFLPIVNGKPVEPR